MQHEPALSSKYRDPIIRSYVATLSRLYPGVDITMLAKSAGVDDVSVNSGLTVDQLSRFHAEAVRITGNQNLARLVGQSSCSPQRLKCFLPMSMRLKRAVCEIREICSKGIPAAGLELLHVLPGQIVMELCSHNNNLRHVADYRHGVIEGAFWRLDIDACVEAEAMERFQGDAGRYRYTIRWHRGTDEFYKAASWTAVVAGVFTGLAQMIGYGPHISNGVTAVIVTGAFFVALLLERHMRQDCQQQIKELGEPTDQLMRQVNENHTNALVVNEIGTRISSIKDQESLLGSVLEVLLARCQFSCASILLATNANNELVLRAYYNEGNNKAIKTFATGDGRRCRIKVARILEYVYDRQQSLLLKSPEELMSRFGTYPPLDIETMSAHSVALCPIICDGAVLGVIIAGNTKEKRGLTPGDLNLLMGIAPLLGVCIHSSELLEGKNHRFGVIKELEKSLNDLAVAKANSERAAIELKEANEEVKSFAYIVSHDLRAPLVNIKGYAKELKSALDDIALLLAPAVERLTGSQRKQWLNIIQEDVPEAISYIEGSADKMDLLISAILKLNRLSRKDLAIEPVDLSMLCSTILVDMKELLQAGDITVDVSALPVIHCDKGAIDMVLRNLLDNAVKYLSPAVKGHITVKHHVAQGWIKITITDNGRGIAREDLDKVFDVFRRAGRQDRPGTGMGLAYVRSMLRRLGGRIRCQSELGAGSSFIVELPASLLQATCCDDASCIPSEVE